VAASVATALADEPRTRRISVTGVAKIEARADTIELTVPVSASAPLASQALKNFREMRIQALAAIKALKIDGLSVTQEGVSVSVNSNPDGGRMMQNIVVGGILRRTSVEPGNGFRENLLVRVSGIDQLNEDQVNEICVKLADGFKSANVSGPANYSIAFRLQQLRPVEDRALEAAIADARSKAARLAHLLNVKLGSVARAQEVRPQSSELRTLSQRVNPSAASSGSKFAVTATVHIEFDVAD
jgi:uncharacterized protein YggE